MERPCRACLAAEKIVSSSLGGLGTEEDGCTKNARHTARMHALMPHARVQAWHGIWRELIALTTDATALSTPTTGSVPGQRGSLRELQRVARALLNSYGIDLS